MERLFNKVLVALSITMLVAGSANGMNYVTGFFSTAKDKISTAINAINKENITLAKDAVVNSRVVTGLKTVGTTIADSRVGQFVAANSTAFKVAGGVAAVAGAGYLVRNPAKKLYSKLFTTVQDFKKNQGGNKQTFVTKYTDVTIDANNASDFRKEATTAGYNAELINQYIATQLGQRNGTEAVTFKTLIG